MTFGSFQDPVSLALSPQFLLQRWGPLNWAGWLRNRESKLPLTESRHPELLGELIPILKLISEKFFFFRRTSATNFCMFALCLLVRLPILPNDATPHHSCQVVNVALSWAVCQGFHGSYLWFFLMVLAWGNFLGLLLNTLVCRLVDMQYIHSKRWS